MGREPDPQVKAKAERGEREVFPKRGRRSKIGESVKEEEGKREEKEMEKVEQIKKWSGMLEDVAEGMARWREENPKATLREIEKEMDRRWVRVRAGMVTDLAVESQAGDWKEIGKGEGPVCPECGTKLKAEGGKKERRLQTQGGEELILERRYGVCPTCKGGFFPPG